MTGRKQNVITDELNIKGAGMYALLPYEKLDEYDKAVFKIGMTTQSFQSRIEQYHSYYPLGVYMVCFLKNPPVKGSGFRKKSTLYPHIERWIMDKLKSIHGVHQIHSTARARHLNVNKEGETEFFYSTESHIKKVFELAQQKFGGELISFDLDEINDNYEKNLKAKRKYIAEIVYNLHK